MTSVSTISRSPSDGARERGSEPGGGFSLSGDPTPVRQLLREIWEARDLLTMLARKNFYVRYRRASLGMLWAAGLPLVQSIVLAVVFSQIVRVGTDVPYAAFVFSGTLAWSYFSTVTSTCSTAIVTGTFMSNRIYFPRAVLVLNHVLTNLYPFWINVAIAVAVAAIFGVSLGPTLLLIIPATMLMVALVSVIGLLTAALHVYFRDVKFMVMAALGAWIYLTPIIYPLGRAPDGLEWLIKANPLTGVVVMFRAAIVGGDPGWVTPVWFTLGWIVVLGIAALLVHRRFDRVFVDLL